MPAAMEIPRSEKRGPGGVAIAAILIFATLSILAAVYSDGFLTGDACTHYLYARFALHDAAYLFDVWGRPMVTALDALPAMIGGRLGVRMMSLALAIGCGLLAWRWAAEEGMRWPVLALIFTLGQPWLFLHSFSEMTELPFAAALGLAFWAYLRRRWFLMACLAAVLPLGRPEGFVFLAVAAGVLVWEGGWKRFAYLPILAVPLLAWNVGGWAVDGCHGQWWRWLGQKWPWSEHSAYGHGSLFAFAGQLPVIVGPIVLPATLVGLAVYLWPWRDRQSMGTPRVPAPWALAADADARRARLAIALVPLAVLAGHSLLYWRGILASYGEPRYLLIVAPFWGVLTAAGWECTFAAMRWRRPIAWAALAAAAPLLFDVIHPIVPVRADADWLQARRFAEWYRSDIAAQHRYPRLVATHTGVYYYLDLDPNDSLRAAPKTRATFAHPPPGTMLVWDPLYGAQNADNRLVIAPAELLNSGWKELPSAESAFNDSAPTDDCWRVFGR
jgi:hypothetical protein